MLDKEDLEQLLLLLFTGTVNLENLPLNLYESMAQHLFDGAQKGFGKTFEHTLLESPDYNILKSFENNCYRFSAAKTFQEVYEIQKHIFDEDGYKRSFNKFRDDAMGTYDEFNKNWLKTEYNTAIAQGQACEQWQEIVKQKETLPYSTFRTVEDDRVRPDHQALDGICLPVNHEFWDTNFPPLEFNCRCGVEQSEEGNVTPDDEVKEKVSGIDINESFRFNPGKEHIAFSDAHPYFDVPEKYQSYKDNNFRLPLPDFTEASPKKAELPKFEFQPTLKAAETWALANLNIQFVSFKGLDLRVANDINESVFKIKQLMPEIKTHGIGSAQEANKALRTELTTMIRQSDEYQKTLDFYRLHYDEKKAQKFTEISLKRKLNQTFENVGPNVVAWSTSRDDVPMTINGKKINYDISKYKGVFVNTKFGKDADLMNKLVQDNEKSGWYFKGANNFGAIMSHEIGHEIDKTIGFKNTEVFKKIYEREHAKGINHVIKNLSKYGATAGGKASHKPDEMIAEAWAEFVTSKTPRPLAKEIGEAMLKEYHDYYVKGSGKKFSEWRNEILKILEK